MKKNRKNTLIVILVHVFLGSVSSFSCASSVPEETEAYKTFCGDSYQFRYYFFKGHSCHDVSTTFPQLKKEQLYASTHFFDSLIHRGNYEEAFRLPVVYRDCPKYAHSPTGGFPQRSDLPATAVAEITKNFLIYVDGQAPAVFDNFLRTSEYDQAYRFARAYGDIFSEVYGENVTTIRENALDWLERIRHTSTTKVENIARVIQALDSFPDLQAEQQAQAASIIGSFPEGHELRIYLQDRFDIILASPRPPAPDESQRATLRKMADRLFG